MLGLLLVLRHPPPFWFKSGSIGWPWIPGSFDFILECSPMQLDDLLGGAEELAALTDASSGAADGPEPGPESERPDLAHGEVFVMGGVEQVMSKRRRRDSLHLYPWSFGSPRHRAEPLGQRLLGRTLLGRIWPHRDPLGPPWALGLGPPLGALSIRLGVSWPQGKLQGIRMGPEDTLARASRRDGGRRRCVPR